MKEQNNNPRAIALEAICFVVLEKKSLSAFIFPQNNNTPLIKSLTFGTIRFYHQLNDIISKLLTHALKKDDIDVFNLMLLGAYQILFTKTAVHAAVFETVEVAKSIDKSWAKSLVNAILREVERNKESLLKQKHFSHPSWLAKKIKNYYPDSFEQIFLENNTKAPMTLRMHPNHDLMTSLAHQRIDTAPQALILDKAVGVDKLENFDKGCCYVQDASAQLAGHLLNPKNADLILDACAAPGGKATHLAELATNSKIIALDNDENRLVKIKQNIERFNIKNIKVKHGNAQNQDWWNGKIFDKILLDAPCSATGIIRRHPDIKLLRKPKDITKLVSLQQQILENLWQMLKPGGALLYATCSILKSENEEQIVKFLSIHQDAKEEKITLDWGIKTTVGRQQLPCYEFDGFYYAKITKLQ